MKTLALPYGSTAIELELNSQFLNRSDVYASPEHALPGIKNTKEIYRVISQTVNNYSFSEKNTIAIAINDTTRPIPYDIILPPLVQFLENNGAKENNITYYVATGTHRAPSSAELKTLIPTAFPENIRTYVHNFDDSDNLSFLGISKAGTPVYINKRFYESDIKIVTGHIEPHHFMGFSGGVKSAVIGLGGRTTIESNHSMLTAPNARMGMFSANPMRMDVEEIGRMIGVDLALNVVLDNKKEIVGVFFGEPKSVMQKGIALSRNLCQMQAPQDYDLVICSAGGFPKDINLYQAQKAITHASAFLKDGGVVLLSAECREGFGSKGFQQFLESHQHPQDIIRTFENSQFNIGPHKAYQLALQAQRYQIVLISSLETQHALKNMINQVKNLKTGIDLCRQWLPHDPKIAILPYATHLMNMQEYEK